MRQDNETKYDCMFTLQEDSIKKLNKVTLNYNMPEVINVSNGIVLPRKIASKPYQGLGGVVSEHGDFIDKSAIYDLRNDESSELMPFAYGGAYKFSQKQKKTNKAIYMGLAHQQWGHFLVDIIQRAWYVYNLMLSDELDEEYIYVFSGFGDGTESFKKNYMEFYRLLGIDINKIMIVNEPTQFKSVIVPDVAIYPGECVHKVYIDMINKVIENASKEFTLRDSIKDIYFSRTHLKDDKEIGEIYLETILRDCGVKILYPEELSLIDQIYYWQHAERIFCVAGSIAHNCIFSGKKTELYIFNKMKRMVGYQFTMDKIQGIYPVYIDAFKEPFKRYPIDVSRGPFWIDVSGEVRNFINTTYGEKINNKITLKSWIDYFWICIIAEIKFRLRGKRAKIKLIINKIKNNIFDKEGI